jgi:hypothetical protein
MDGVRLELRFPSEDVAMRAARIGHKTGSMSFALSDGQLLHVNLNISRRYPR